MRKRKNHECVCSSRPDGQVMNMSSRELEEQVRWGMKAIECSGNTRSRAMRGLQLGRLCENAGHPVLALRVWMETLEMVRNDNFEWENMPINTAVYSFDSKIAFTEQEELGRQIDRLWRQLGHEEMAHFKRMAEDDYRSIWLWKYQEPYWEY